MPWSKISTFLIGLIIGVAVMETISVVFNLDISPPMPQDTARIEVSIVRLKPEDQWLEKVRFQVVPLDGVKSAHKYAVLLMTPPSGGIHIQAAAASAELDLTASTSFWTTVETSGHTYSYPEGIQPIEINSGDFGANGDQVGVKFIDEGEPIDKANRYLSSQHLLIGSP